LSFGLASSVTNPWSSPTLKRSFAMCSGILSTRAGQWKGAGGTRAPTRERFYSGSSKPSQF
jgi:hypothetical protein